MMVLRVMKRDFSFTTTTTGKQTLVVSFFDLWNFKNGNWCSYFQKINHQTRVNALDAVITAGTLEAGDKSRVSALKPLDIVTTAGSAGNIIAALQTLPGTQTVGEDGRLFVRGGRTKHKPCRWHSGSATVWRNHE
jgi:hypothetical protein